MNILAPNCFSYYRTWSSGHLVHPLTSKHHAFVFFGQGIVTSQMTVVVASDSWEMFCILQSELHWKWVLEYGNKLETRPQYTSSDCFDTFAFPTLTTSVGSVGERYYNCRRQIMLSRHEGLTDTYNRVHDSNETSADIHNLRHVHVELDHAVAGAYGWNDLDLGHGFHETKLGVRFTISEDARREVLARLLKLNHERYAEEVAKGLHEKKGGSKKAASAGTSNRSSKSAAAMLAGFDDEPRPAEKHPASGPNRTSTRENRSALATADRPTPIDQLDITEIMAAFRQVARGRGWLDRNELLKEVSVSLGFQRLGPKIEEKLRSHLRAAIRRRIIEADGRDLVRAGTSTMADYGLDELREMFASVMRKGTDYEREEVIQSVARYLGFARLTDTGREPLKSAINSAIRHGVLGYEGSLVWREQ